jgi:hypothetical protein
LPEVEDTNLLDLAPFKSNFLSEVVEIILLGTARSNFLPEKSCFLLSLATRFIAVFGLEPLLKAIGL